MKKLTFLFALLCASVMSWAGSYTITFKDSGNTSDSSSGLSSKTVADYVASGEDNVSAISASGKVYLAASGYGLKFGNSSNPGSITLTLAAAIKPTSIVMVASQFGASEGSGLLQDGTYDMTGGGGKGKFNEYTYEYDGKTEVTSITVGTKTKRGYVKSVTVNYTSSDPSLSATVGSIAFGEKNVYYEAQRTGTSTFKVSGENLTEDITLTLSGANADKFTVSPATLDKAANGAEVEVGYTIDAAGEYAAVLTLASGEKKVEIALTVSAINLEPAVYAKVTDDAILKAGDKLIIVATANKRAAGAISGKVLSYVDLLSIADDKVSVTTEKVNVFTLGGEKDAWTLTSSEGQLTSTTAKEMIADGTGTWSITIDEDANATIKTDVGSILYNSGSPRFTTYKSGQTAVQLYKLDAEEGGDDTGCKWDELAWIGDGMGGGTYNEQFKVCTTDANQKVVNLQIPGFDAEGPGGIYTNFEGYGAITATSLAEGQYKIDGAGICIYLAALTAKYTDITVTCAVDSKEFAFTVYNAKGTEPVVAVESVTLNKTALTLEPAAEETLTATVAPTNATDKTVTWASDNEAVATVDANGKVTAVAVGTATITATAGEKTATCAVTVAEAKKATIAEVLAAIPDSGEGEEFALNDVTVTYVSGKNVYVKDATGAILIFSEVTGAANGKVLKGLKGKAKLYSKLPEISTITVAPTVEDGEAVLPEELAAAPTTADVNKYAVLKDVTFAAAATIKDKQNVTGSFKESNVVIRGNFGLTQDVEAGKKYDIEGVVGIYNTTIQFYPSKVTEVVVPATGIALDETELALNVGESKTLTATVTPEDATDKTVTWTSSNEEVATVANGVVTGVADGTATITAKIGELTAECTVTVKFEAVPVTGVTLSETEMELVVGDEDVINITVAPENANNQNVTVDLSAEDIIEAELIDKTIAVKALKAGEVTITITTEDGDFTASCKVTVKNPKQYALAEFIEAAPTAEVLLKDLTVIYASGKNTYVIDEEGTALVIYDANKTYYDGTLTAGKVLSGQKATYTAYNNQDEIVPTNTATISDGVAPVPTLLNEQPTTAQVNKYIRLENIEATLNGSFYYAYDGDLQLYGASGSLKPTANGKYNVEGIIVHFKGTQLEIIVTAIEPVKATALDALTDSTKAVKLIENGQVVILRDGKKFNVLGAEVK